MSSKRGENAAQSNKPDNLNKPQNLDEANLQPLLNEAPADNLKPAHSDSERVMPKIAQILLPDFRKKLNELKKEHKKEE